MPGLWAVSYSLCCLSGGFCVGLMPLSFVFRGGAVRFSFFSDGLWLLVLFLVFCWAFPFWE